MKRIVVLLCIIACIQGLEAQQSPLYTQYMHNPFVLNPAIAGTNNFFQIRSMTRLQWVGFTDAPLTISLSVYGPVSAKSKDMGYGATIYNDVTGPTSRAGLKGAYAYNISINDQIRASFGAAFGLLQYKYDGTKINLYQSADPKSTKSVQSFFLPDGMLGVYVYSTNFQVGFSADNLFNNTITIDKDSKAVGISKLKRHYYFMGAYTYIFNRRYSMESSVVLKGVSPAPLQMDINARLIYQKNTWVGLSFRSMDAVSLMGGYIFNKRIYIGYSVDVSITAIRPYSFGSHELMIGYRFNSLK